MENSGLKTVEAALAAIGELAERKFGLGMHSKVMDVVSVGMQPPIYGDRELGWQVWLVRPTKEALRQKPKTLEQVKNQQTCKNYPYDTYFYVAGGKRTLLETLNVLYGLLQSIEVINGNPARYERP